MRAKDRATRLHALAWIEPTHQVRLMFKYEHRNQPPLSRMRFVRRLARQGVSASFIILGSLAMGMAGYHSLADQSWVDAFLNAAMLLGGMGPVGELHSTSAKIFAGIYALYAGIVFLVLAAMLLGPVFHRVLHFFHWEADQAANKKPKAE
jgi:hypothetical protein